MTLTDLRMMVFDHIGLTMEQDVFPDYKLVQCWNDATSFWSLYRNPIKGAETLGLKVDESRVFEFTNRIPQKIDTLFRLPQGNVIPCWLYLYTKPVLTLKKELAPGDFAICYEGSLGYEDMEKSDVPIYLLKLLAAYTKRRVGQFLKFADYTDKPFPVDGEQWYMEGEKETKEVEEFIRINRDERISNLTDFNLLRGSIFGAY